MSLCETAAVDAYTGQPFAGDCEVDHVVALAEAEQSGIAAADRRRFANDSANHAPVRRCLNRSKGSRDAAEWNGRVGSGQCAGLAVTAAGRCTIATVTVRVKARYSMAVDRSERAALASWLEGCP